MKKLLLLLEKVPIFRHQNTEKVPIKLVWIINDIYFCSQYEIVMLYRKFARRIEDFLSRETGKILLVNGARQIGKSYLIRPQWQADHEKKERIVKM